jgi:hypothetical protein
LFSTCGNHKCSLDTPCLSHYNPEDITTHYQKSYPEHKIQHVPQRDEHAPRQNLHVGNEPFNAKTTNQTNLLWNGTKVNIQIVFF